MEFLDIASSSYNGNDRLIGPTIFADWKKSQESQAIDDMAAVEAAMDEMSARVKEEFILVDNNRAKIYEDGRWGGGGGAAQPAAFTFATARSMSSTIQKTREFFPVVTFFLTQKLRNPIPNKVIKDPLSLNVLIPMDVH